MVKVTGERLRGKRQTTAPVRAGVIHLFLYTQHELSLKSVLFRDGTQGCICLPAFDAIIAAGVDSWIEIRVEFKSGRW